MHEETRDLKHALAIPELYTVAEFTSVGRNAQSGRIAKRMLNEEFDRHSRAKFLDALACRRSAPPA